MNHVERTNLMRKAREENYPQASEPLPNGVIVVVTPQGREQNFAGQEYVDGYFNKWDKYNKRE